MQVTHAKTIVAALREMSVASEPVSIYLADGVHCICGRLVQIVEPATGVRFVVLTEPAPIPPEGPALLVAGADTLRLQFQANFSWRQNSDQTLEGTADVPGHMLRRQRRRFARLEMPLGPTLRAEFHAQGKKRVMTLDDLSVGGVGLRGPQREHRDLLTNQRLERVRLDLGHGTVLLDMKLDVCSRRSYRSFLAGEQLHFGCQFAELTDSAKSVIEGVLERMEQERRLGVSSAN